MKYSKKVGSLPRLVATVAVATAITGVFFIGSAASAASLDVNTSTSTSTTLTPAQQQQHLQNIINKGNQEIARRFTTLNQLTSKINTATKLAPGDKATLNNEVATTIQGLTGLKMHLDADTTLSAAHTDAEDIYTEYRVYYLVVPKVRMVKVADDQQAIQANLTTTAQKLQTRITAEQKAGKDVSALQTDLNNMNNEIAAAHVISNNIETSIINLQPSDYNSNHDLLVGDNTQLANAHSDDQAAVNNAKTIVTALKNMK